MIYSCFACIEYLVHLFKNPDYFDECFFCVCLLSWLWQDEHDYHDYLVSVSPESRMYMYSESLDWGHPKYQQKYNVVVCRGRQVGFPL